MTACHRLFLSHGVLFFSLHFFVFPVDLPVEGLARTLHLGIISTEKAEAMLKKLPERRWEGSTILISRDPPLMSRVRVGERKTGNGSRRGGRYSQGSTARRKC